MSQTLERKRKYKATFILDTRGYEEPVENLNTLLSDSIVACGGEVEETISLGRMDFVRITEKNHVGDNFVEVFFNGVPTTPAALQEKLRLEKRVKRIITELVEEL